VVNYNFVPKALAPLKKQRLLDKIAVFDMETSPWLMDTYGMTEKEVMRWHNKPIKPFLVGLLIDGEITYYDGKDCVKDFLIDYLHFSRRPYICFAHNGGKFDFLSLYETLRSDPELSEKFTAKAHMAHSRMIAMTVYDKHKHTWKFRDSFALLSSSLEKLCEDFKPEHNKLEMSEEDYHIPYKGHEQFWKRYLDNDLWSLFEILTMFNKVIAEVGGCVGFTIASTAMSTFRKKFLKQPIPTYFKWNNFVRIGYSGGRVEVFNMYAMDVNKPYYYYDCNSEYPSVMYEQKFPISKPERVHYKDADECIGKCGIMECDVITPPDLDIPILSFRTPDKKLLFPLGSWRASYEFSLIEKALKYGYVIKPKRVIEFQGERIFNEYVGRFYDLKKHSEGAVQKTMKLLLNCLYGKFGEKSEREELVTDPDDDIIGTFPTDSEFGYTIRKFLRYSGHHLPAIAARVTALAQLRLYNFIEYAQSKGGTIYYCDTDSVITDVRLPTSRELGEWKLEHEFIEGAFLAPKTYCLHTFDKDKPFKLVMKGFSKSLQNHLTLKDFERALPPHNDFTPFQEMRISPASFKTIYRRHLDGFVTEVSKKSIKQIYTKRKINDDLTTEPLQVINGEVQWAVQPSEELEPYEEEITFPEE